MSNVISQNHISSLTRHQLVYLLGDLLNKAAQNADGYCPWCGNEEFPVDEQGELIIMPEEEEVSEYRINHDKECAVAEIEAMFDGTYQFLNPPKEFETPVPYGMREATADVQHQIWAHWMNYVFSICPQQEDGSVIIPAEKVERWKRQMDTPYKELSEKEKESDRHQADKVLEALNYIWSM